MIAVRSQRIYITNVNVTDLKLGMLVRFATDAELAEDGRRRRTSAWTPNSEASFCYTDKTAGTYRVFPINEEILEALSRHNDIVTAHSIIPQMTAQYAGWAVSLSEVFLITEESLTEKTLIELIKIELTSEKPIITPVLASYDNSLIEKLKALNEKAIKGTEKEANTYYQTLSFPVNVKLYKIKTEEQQ